MSGDAVILIENGVYSLSEHSAFDSAIPVYAVEADVLARGVQPGEAIGLVDYIGFVQLCTDYDKVVTW
ncbi:MAG: tRNA 2-thiouridine synthesizing protein B [Candidatus Azotimanducaceae bacterium]|jgi:tRNA 2-thiouridine synthesizing protein B